MHIPQDELQKFQSGTMDTEEMIHFLEHMEQCDFCLDQLLQEDVYKRQDIVRSVYHDLRYAFIFDQFL